MINPPKGFPTNCSTEVINKFLKELSEIIDTDIISYESATAQAARENIELGQNELLVRSISDLDSSIGSLEYEIRLLRESNQTAMSTAKRMTVLSIILSSITIVLVVATVIYSHIDFSSDEQWRNEQLELLKSQNSKLDSIDTHFIIQNDLFNQLNDRNSNTQPTGTNVKHNNL